MISSRLRVLRQQNRMGGRAVEGTGLENRQTLAGLVGSNPTPSANLSSYQVPGIPGTRHVLEGIFPESGPMETIEQEGVRASVGELYRKASRGE
jgi:hypothetical protein